ncbi:hypothetical protein SAMN05421803_114138 [Nocardiopsis flavescens]|uniref:Uncharacterized protein n=1 Tax=Nocardiopsis flavescens TaxID=758803 RepID=A0A1M6Q7V2_9ACTN|nr:hypothetical protein SAMN05421803_114138 [Nocardiopsis flavescens]
MRVTASGAGVPSEVGSDRALPVGPFLRFHVVGRGRPRPRTAHPHHPGRASNAPARWSAASCIVGADPAPPVCTFPSGDRPGNQRSWPGATTDRPSQRVTVLETSEFVSPPRAEVPGACPETPCGGPGEYPRPPPRATLRGSDALRPWPGAPGGWTTPTGWAGRVPAAPHPHGSAEPGTPSSTPWSRGAAPCSRAVPGAQRPCTLHPLRRWEGMGVLYVRAAPRAPHPLQGAFLPPQAVGLGSPRSTQPRMTPPPLRTCIERTGPALCRPPTAPGPGPRSAGRPFHMAELSENSGRALTPVT